MLKLILAILLLIGQPAFAEPLIGICSNSLGRVGIRVNNFGEIILVRKVSPAAGLLYRGDKVLACNGKKGYYDVDGPPYSNAHITVKRLGEIKEFDITRIPKDEIHD